ncbi:uncharacterized protein CANTADRAFT_8118 [Suhomyces tanzawaensis NRRL Y-17324]|uniref:Uncharacterized protein n=1 Tax=Suhomyces tanzawaensis NRRL Y-17324 TaxID=984487 RepID=A0A1E4SBR6_9ASCO|nr:uncharacterized protein CANTADRAFT_8118 [Suhomyces tanzawaensis NRRL Y-17324]ODV76941.1 hypothetical protein CANTADRAFT_8118 [Suhomyces tanzawaensis NRRL Y-17324]
MSFYLLPAANYQTQQKLKEQMEGKKRELRKHSSTGSKKSSKSSAAPSIIAPSAYSSRTPRTSISSSGNDQFAATRKMSITSGDSKSSNETTLTAPSRKTQAASPSSNHHMKADNESFYDNYSPYSRKHIIKSSASSTAGSIDSSRRPSAVPSSFNYSSNLDMSQVLKVSKQHALHKKSTKLSESMSNLSIGETSGFDSESKDIKVEFKNVNFQVLEPPQVATKQPEETIDTIASDEDEDSEAESASNNNLTKVYSNVSSIFSTKNDPSLYKSQTASTAQSSSPLASHKNSNDNLNISQKLNKFSRFKKKFSV